MKLCLGESLLVPHGAKGKRKELCFESLDEGLAVSADTNATASQPRLLTVFRAYSTTFSCQSVEMALHPA